MKKNLFKILIILVVGFVYYYFNLPTINLQDPNFWLFISFLVIIFLIINVIINTGFSNKIGLNKITEIFHSNKKTKYILFCLIAIIPIIIIINFICSPLFNAGSYAKRINIDESKTFNEAIKEADFSKVPLLDKASSQKLGDRVMGEMTDLVSQFKVSDLYTQINYNDSIIRVTPLEYADIIKYFTNQNNGVKGYIKVDSVTGKASLQRLDKGMKYMPSALFFENLARKLRFAYPTTIFGEESFEIDNEGNPYWIVPTLSYTGIGLKTKVTGAVILDPITGNSKRYKTGNIPTWVDHVYPANLIIEQIDDWGNYNNGFFNSIFGQKGVVNTTDGYNYLVMDDDVYLYTGITSVASDESNLGFVLCNLRTKETNFYSAPGAEEYSAMASAKGQVQQMNYTATFPLLVNLKGNPTYLLSLKDNAGLVKMYALVDVIDYQKVVVTDASFGINKAVSNYLTNTNIIASNQEQKKITVKTIASAIIDGDTYYYIVDNLNNKYRASIKTNKNMLPFVKANDIINITYSKGESISEISNID